MKKIWLIVGALLSASVQAQTAITPDSFAWHAKIDAPGTGPFYQAPLPLGVYTGVKRADLGDLRVFNAAGEVVPHAWLQARPSTVSDRTESPLTVFVLRAAGNAPGGWSLDVTRNRDGTLVAMRQAEAGPGTMTAGALFDISQLHQNAHALKLALAPNAAAFQHFSLDTSDDLQSWRPLADGQIVRLERDGQRIENNRIEWDGEAGKYLRVLWREPQSAAEIVSAAVSITHTATRSAPMLWSGALLPATVQKDLYEYQLPGRLPLEQLRIELAQPNTLAPVIVQRYQPGYGQRREQGSWLTIASTIAYRLAAPQGEERSLALQLNLPPESRLRLAIDSRGGGVGAVAPSIQVGFTPRVLVFLARGNGPFMLAWGAVAMPPSALALASLVPGYDADQALTAAAARIAFVPPAQTAGLPGPAALASSVKSKGLLWLALLAGVAILGGMAWLLIRQMQSAPQSPHDQ